MTDLQIKGAEQLGDLAKALRSAGDTGKGLKRELYRGLNRATKPLRADARASALAVLPQSGGLAAQVFKSRLSTKILTGRNPAVAIAGKSGSAAAQTDRGHVKHPVYGNKRVWVTQQVDGAGWFTDTMKSAAPTVRKELVQAIDNVADQIKKAT